MNDIQQIIDDVNAVHSGDTKLSVDDDGVIHVEVKKPLNGRRALRAELEARYKLAKPDPMNTSRLAKMGSRRARRLLQGKDFKPVIGHGIPAPNHGELIAAMKVLNRKTKAKWFKERGAQ